MTETETSRPELNREIATTADGIDITRGYTGPLMLPTYSVLRNRGGYDLEIYEQVLSDDEVKATLEQRHRAVTSCETQVDAGGNRRVDKQAADFVREQLEHIGWDNVTTKMLFGEFYGYAVSELIYAADGARIGIDKIKVRNRRRFRYGKEGDLRLLTQSSMTEGIPCERPYFWDFCVGADHDDEPYGLGLAHWLYWPVLFKRNGIKFWLIFLEKFGMPTGVGKYDADASADEKGKLLRAVRAIQSDSGIIIPKGMEVDLLEAGRSGTADYKTLVDTMNATIQKVVLGQTASTQGTPGKLGNENLQADVRGDIIKAAADLICESFNRQVVPHLVRWNFPTAALPKVYRVTEEQEDLDSRAERDSTIHAMGFKPTLAYITETYGGEWAEKEAPPQLDAAGNPIPPTAISGAEFAAPERAVRQLLQRHGMNFAEGGKADDPPAQMARQLDRKLLPVGRERQRQIRAIVDNAASLEQLEQQLLELAPAMSLDEFADVYAEAMTAAHLAGRYELIQG